jgi:hypothetical protein
MIAPLLADGRRRMRTVATVLALLVGGAGFTAFAENRHDLNHPIYENWQRPDGRGSCCSNMDCRPVAYRSHSGGIDIRIEELGGAWHPVPPQAILPFASFDAEAHACYQLRACHAYEGCRLAIRCVVLPANM